MTDKQILKKSLEKAAGNGYTPGDSRDRWYFEVIFSHDFAKAFFPRTDGHGFHKDDAWKFHLQQMVLEENPLHYLEQFLDQETS